MNTRPKSHSLARPSDLVHPQVEAIPAQLEIHPSVSWLAAELLMKTSEMLSREPRRYNQAICDTEQHGCGSPCCILGHMLLFVNVLTHGINAEIKSLRAEQTGLSTEQLDRLFFRHQWPAQWKKDSNLATPEEGIARIEWFLRTGE